MIIIELGNNQEPHAKSYEAMEEYIKHNGHHFNEKLLKFALDYMFKNGKKIVPYTKETVDKMLAQYNIRIDANPYDYVYVANMCMADFLNSSIPDDNHLCKYIQDYIHDEDGYDGIVFDRWYSDAYHKHLHIDWDAMI